MSIDRSPAYRVRVKAARHHGHSLRTRRVLLRGLGVATFFIALIVVASFSMARLYQAASNEQTPVGKSNDSRFGSVVMETNDQYCELLKFDNYSGHTVENSIHCQKVVVLDAKGVPVPLGTVHRLDSISKSFLGPDR
jgi:hypothetical protein